MELTYHMVGEDFAVRLFIQDICRGHPADKKPGMSLLSWRGWAQGLHRTTKIRRLASLPGRAISPPAIFPPPVCRVRGFVGGVDRQNLESPVQSGESLTLRTFLPSMPARGWVYLGEVSCEAIPSRQSYAEYMWTVGVAHLSEKNCGSQHAILTERALREPARTADVVGQPAKSQYSSWSRSRL